MQKRVRPPQTGSFPRRRHKGRMLALQVLYEVDVAHHSPESSLEALVDGATISREAMAFARHLVRLVLEHRQELDRIVQRFAPDWPVRQLPVVDRNVLRLAIYELVIEQETPPKAVINEAVELARTFGGESSPKFVNGVLGSVMELAHPTPEL